jgi:pyridoxal phosphate enzyme (YggS family)
MDALTLDRETFSRRIDGVQERVAVASARAGRNPDEVTIVAVSKTFSREAVDAVHAAGLSHFGENRVQEATAKFAAPLPSDLRLHLIGQLQTNKVKPAIALFDRIESVDRPSLIAAIEKEAAKQDTIVNVLLQVNIAREPQKSGCDPDEAGDLVNRICASPHLRLDGLMTIAPFVPDPEEVRQVFRATRKLRDDLNRANPKLDLHVLSMGMSGDFEIAVEEGATHIRIGSAIFGSR